MTTVHPGARLGSPANGAGPRRTARVPGERRGSPGERRGSRASGAGPRASGGAAERSTRSHGGRRGGPASATVAMRAAVLQGGRPVAPRRAAGPQGDAIFAPRCSPCCTGDGPWSRAARPAARAMAPGPAPPALLHGRSPLVPRRPPCCTGARPVPRRPPRCTGRAFGFAPSRGPAAPRAALLHGARPCCKARRPCAPARPHCNAVAGGSAPLAAGAPGARPCSKATRLRHGPARRGRSASGAAPASRGGESLREPREIRPVATQLDADDRAHHASVRPALVPEREQVHDRLVCTLEVVPRERRDEAIDVSVGVSGDAFAGAP